MLSEEDRFSGLYTIGATGMGKTTLLLNLVLEDIAQGRGVGVIDSVGELTDQIIARCRPQQQEIVVLDPLRISHPFGLNIFSCNDPNNPLAAQATVEQVIHIFQKIWADSWGDRLEDILRNCAYVLVEHHLTLAQVPRLLADEKYRAGKLATLKNREVKWFWEREYANWGHEQITWRNSTLVRVREFTSNQVIRNIVGQTETIDFRQVMDQGKILLVKLPIDSLKEGPVRLLGSVIVSQLLSAAISRQDQSERRPFFLFVDEYHRFATSDFPELLTQVRKYNVGVTIAHQARYQLDGANKEASLQVPNKIVFKVSGEDAQELAREFDATPPPGAVSGMRRKRSLLTGIGLYLLNHDHQATRFHDNIRVYLRTWHEWEQQIPYRGYGEVVPTNTNEADAIGNPPSTRLVVLRNERNMDYETSLLLEAYNRTGSSDTLENKMGLDFTPPGRYVISQVALQEFLSDLDQYLYSRMSGTNDVEQLIALLVKGRGVLAFAEQYLFQNDNPIEIPPDEEFIRLTACHVLDQHQPGYEVASEHRIKLLQSRVNQNRRGLSREVAKYRAISEQARLVQFVITLNSAGRYLLETPIEEESGEYEPIYDRPLSTAEVRDQIANSLTKLEQFHAKARFLTGETEIAVSFPTEHRDTPLTPTYQGRSRDEVESEIERMMEDTPVPQKLTRPPRREW